jgi:hypothetical protein
MSGDGDGRVMVVSCCLFELRGRANLQTLAGVVAEPGLCDCPANHVVAARRRMLQDAASPSRLRMHSFVRSSSFPLHSPAKDTKDKEVRRW